MHYSAPQPARQAHRHIISAAITANPYEVLPSPNQENEKTQSIWLNPSHKRQQNSATYNSNIAVQTRSEAIT